MQTRSLDYTVRLLYLLITREEGWSCCPNTGKGGEVNSCSCWMMDSKPMSTTKRSLEDDGNAVTKIDVAGASISKACMVKVGS